MRYIFTLSMILLAMTNWAQTPTNKQRQLLHDVPIYPCSIIGQTDDNPLAEVGLKFAKFDSIGAVLKGTTVTHYIVQFLEYPNALLQSRFNYKMTPQEIAADTKSDIRATDVSLRKYFLISKLDYDYGTKPIVQERNYTITGGALTIPIKLRFDKGRINDFSKDITLSTVGGIRKKNNRPMGGYYILFAGVGLTSVTLDSVNTNGELKGTSERGAATVVGGFMYETDKGLQISLTCGWDHLRKSESIDWCYNGNFWLGLGVGFSLLSEPSNSKTTEFEDQNKVASKKKK
jgi:hypothetical protein